MSIEDESDEERIPKSAKDPTNDTCPNIENDIQINKDYLKDNEASASLRHGHRDHI